MSALLDREQLLARVRARLAEVPGSLSPAVVADAIRAESGGVLGDTDLLAALRVLQTELSGAGPLEALLRETSVADVLVTAPHQVWVDRGEGLQRTDVRFADEAAVRRLAQRLALSAGRRLDEAQPWVDGRLPDAGYGGAGVRLHAVLPPVAADGTCLSLRVLRPATQGLDALITAGAVTAEAARLLEAIVTARLAFLVVGGTGAGNTAPHLRQTQGVIMSTTPVDIDAICELAERDGDRPAAPSWHRDDYPAIEGCNADGDPVRGFERDYPTGYRGCYVDLYCQDVHTAQGVQRSPMTVHVDCPSNGATPTQARALAAALLEAADTAEAN